MYAIFIPFSKLCWTLGLFVCLLGDLCFALHLSDFCKTYVWHWVCLFVCLLDLCLALGLSVCGTYVWHWVYLFVYLWDLCLALGLYVCQTDVCNWLGYLEQTQLINCFWNIW